VLSWRGAIFGRVVADMVSDATEAKERNVVIRKDVRRLGEGRAPFNSGRKRCIEGAATVPVILPRPEEEIVLET
jgi:hypothetical protein